MFVPLAGGGFHCDHRVANRIPPVAFGKGLLDLNFKFLYYSLQRAMSELLKNPQFDLKIATKKFKRRKVLYGPRTIKNYSEYFSPFF